VAAFGYAQRFHLQAIQVVVMAASSVILAKFSELVAHGDEQGISRLLEKAGRFSLIIGLCSVAAVWFAGAPLLTWLFGGRFDDAAALRVGRHWLLLTTAITPAILVIVHAKLLQACCRTARLSVVTAVGLLVFLMVAGIGRSLIGELAIPAGVSCSSFAVFFGLWLWRPNLRRCSGCL
jgi:peptidoglycan biosynthesis protein MviN/MurJ (putative lipid II flippase)